VSPPPPVDRGASHGAAASWDAARRFGAALWRTLGEDDVFFLASAIAFNLLLAIAPFLLLLISLSVAALGTTPDEAAAQAMTFLDRFLPGTTWRDGAWVRTTLRDVARAGTSVGVWSAIVFAWFSTRVFGALRRVLVTTFDVGRDRGIVHGKLFDIAAALVLAAGVLLYGALSAYLLAGAALGGRLLTTLGLHEGVFSRVEYALGRAVAFGLVTLLCFALYRWLPSRRIPARTAWVGALTTTVLFEVARWGFAAFMATFRPGSFYTGVLAAVVAATLWVYYAALIFVVGAEVAQVVELQRAAPPAGPRA
jgi:membrane protein